MPLTIFKTHKLLHSYAATSAKTLPQKCTMHVDRKIKPNILQSPTLFLNENLQNVNQVKIYLLSINMYGTKTTLLFISKNSFVTHLYDININIMD